jgi:hypothetical protein
MECKKNEGIFNKVKTFIGYDTSYDYGTPYDDEYFVEDDDDYDEQEIIEDFDDD